MRAPDRLGPRLGRAFVLSGSSIGLGSMAHLWAGGPGAVGAPVFGGAVLVLTLAWVATARQVSWSVIALVLGGGQVITHGALAMGTGMVGTDGAHTHGSAPGLAAPAAADSRMLTLHVIAWALLSWAFTVGERALWRSVARLVAAAPRLWSPLPLPRAAGTAPLTPSSVLAHGIVRGRAPPGS